MALTVTHAVVATGTNDGTKQVSKDAWNDGHVLTGDYLRKATVALASADILALNSTPFTLVAAPGSGKWLAVHKIIGILDFQTTAYLTGDGSSIQYDVGGYGIADPTTLLQQTSSRAEYLAASGPDTDIANVANKPIVLSAAGVTLGDSPVTFIVWYSIEDVP